jgi:hypothetical protein
MSRDDDEDLIDIRDAARALAEHHRGEDEALSRGSSQELADLSTCGALSTSAARGFPYF